jgi:putative peptidoglycan lipid II flippase
MTVVFGAIAYLLHVPEMRQLVGSARRLLNRLRRRGATATS